MVYRPDLAVQNGESDQVARDLPAAEHESRWDGWTRQALVSPSLASPTTPLIVRHAESSEDELNLATTAWEQVGEHQTDEGPPDLAAENLLSSSNPD